MQVFSDHAIKYKDDYARAGIPMLPVVRSMTRVNVEIAVFTVLTVAASLSLRAFGLPGLLAGFLGGQGDGGQLL